MRTSEVAVEGGEIVVRPLIGRLEAVKGLGASWKGGAWRLPHTAMNTAALRELLPEAAADLRPPERRRVPIDGHPRAGELFPYQREAAEKLAGSEHGDLLVMSPGLGKTAISIVAADASVPMDERVLVVAPAPLLRTWAREIARWSADPSSTIAHEGRQADPSARWTITSWDYVAGHWEEFDLRWELAILDESVLAKSKDSRRHIAIAGGSHSAKRGGRTTVVKYPGLRRQTRRVFLLSGDPAPRYPDDLWGQLHIIRPDAFRSYWRFAERYCSVEQNIHAGQGKVVTGPLPSRNAAADNLDLIQVVNQEDVLDLPEYLFETVDVELAPRQARAYAEMLRDFETELEGREVTAQNKGGRLTKLLQIASWHEDSAKHDALVALVKEGVWKTPLVAWTHWRRGASELAKRLPRAAHVHGDLTPREKDRLTEAYKAGDFDCLVLSLGVGKFGHTFTQTRTMAYVDKTFNADEYFQSLRRVRRIGLTHRPLVGTLHAPGTADELVQLNLEGKMQSISQMTNAGLAELLRGLGKEAQWQPAVSLTSAAPGRKE